MVKVEETRLKGWLSARAGVPGRGAGGARGARGARGAGGAGGSAGADDGTRVTVGIFKRTGDDSYTQAPVDSFVFEVGVPCQSWNRRVTMPSSMDATQKEHDHFNAADEVTYDGTVITW